MQNCRQWKENWPGWFGKNQGQGLHTSYSNRCFKNGTGLLGSPEYPLDVACQKSCGTCSERIETDGT